MTRAPHPFSPLPRCTHRYRRTPRCPSRPPPWRCGARRRWRWAGRTTRSTSTASWTPRSPRTRSSGPADRWGCCWRRTRLAPFASRLVSFRAARAFLQPDFGAGLQPRRAAPGGGRHQPRGLHFCAEWGRVDSQGAGAVGASYLPHHGPRLESERAGKERKMPRCGGKRGGFRYVRALPTIERG